MNYYLKLPPSEVENMYPYEIEIYVGMYEEKMRENEKSGEFGDISSFSNLI